jgi:hypothetical protein
MQDGTFEQRWNVNGLSAGVYIATLYGDGKLIQSIKVNVAK